MIEKKDGWIDSLRIIIVDFTKIYIFLNFRGSIF